LKKKNILRLIAAALIFVSLAISWIAASVSEPSHEAKPLSFWLSDLRSDDLGHQQRARRTLTNLEDNAKHWLIGTLDESDSLVRRVFSRRNIRIGHNWSGEARTMLPSGDYKRAMAATALGMMGPRAETAIPSLIRATKDPSFIVAARSQAALAQIRNETPQFPEGTPTRMTDFAQFIRAATILSALGTNIAPLHIKIAEGLRNSLLSAQFDLIQFLCAEKLDPSVIGPLLILCLEDPTLHEIRGNALNAAMIQLNSPLLTDALKASLRNPIIACLSDTNRNVRLNASMVLSQFYSVDTSVVPASVLQQLSKDPDLRAWASEILRQR
jgi:hypothetical protein